MPPTGARLHKGLVVEASRKQPPKGTDQRAEIGFEPWPGMLARRAQPVVKSDVGGAAIGFGIGTTFELNQRRGFLRPGRKDAARAVVFEAARDEAHAIRQQRRSQRVAGMAVIFLPVEGEAQNLATVDLAARR